MSQNSHQYNIIVPYVCRSCVLDNPTETENSVGNTVMSTCVFNSGVLEFVGNKFTISAFRRDRLGLRL
jgi:hypothetical protein